MNSLEQDLAHALDPVALARSVRLEPDPWQLKALRSRAPRMLFNCARQSGKSTIAALLAVWWAMYRPNSLALILCPSQRQSQELFRKVIAFYRALGRVVPAESENALSLTLENGSRVVTLPGSETTVRGFSGVDLLIVDEGARVLDETYYSVRPMLAVSGGQLIAMSTPYGKRGWFYSAWHDQDSNWERYEVPASEVPRISPEFLEEERRSLGEWFYSQEYECQFGDTESQAFRKEDIDMLFEHEVEAWSL